MFSHKKLIIFSVLMIGILSAGCGPDAIFDARIPPTEHPQSSENIGVASEEETTFRLHTNEPDVVQTRIISGTIQLLNMTDQEETDSIKNSTESVSSDSMNEIPGSSQSKSTKSEENGENSWLTYKNSEYNFSLRYPPNYLFEELASAEFSSLSPLPSSVIEFWDKDVIGSDTAELAVPNLSIRIYENKDGLNCEQWLQEAGLYIPGKNWIIEPYEGQFSEGLKVTSLNYMAPGRFVCFTDGRFIYQLTPLGELAEEMIDSFNFLQDY